MYCAIPKAIKEHATTLVEPLVASDGLAQTTDPQLLQRVLAFRHLGLLELQFVEVVGSCPVIGEGVRDVDVGVQTVTDSVDSK